MSLKRLLGLSVIILVMTALGMVVSNHIAYNGVKKDVHEIVSSIEENYGVKVDYSVDYNIVPNMFKNGMSYIKDINIKFPESDQIIEIDEVGIGNVNLMNLDIQLSVSELSLPVGIFYYEESMNPMVESYFNAFERINIDKDTKLNTDFYVDAKDIDGILSLNINLSIERLVGIDLDVLVTGFNPIELSTIMIMPAENQEQAIEKQMAISRAYENINFEKFELDIDNYGLANGILMENQHVYEIESIEESQMMMISEFEAIMEENELNPVMNTLFLELIEFFSDV